MVTIILELDQQIEEEARSLGLLSSERLAQMIEAEVQRERKAAWKRLQDVVAPVQTAFQKEYVHLNDDQVQAMIDTWIDDESNDVQPS
jgi:hypothetical protein